MTTQNKFEDKIREVVTYHSDDGTSGYLLDDARIEKIVKVIREAREEKHTNLVNEIKWWLFDTGKFTNNDLLKFKKRFEPITNSH